MKKHKIQGLSNNGIIQTCYSYNRPIYPKTNVNTHTDNDEKTTMLNPKCICFLRLWLDLEGLTGQIHKSDIWTSGHF